MSSSGTSANATKTVKARRIDLFPWFVIVFAILIVALVVMLLKTRHR
ncbi:hypothetical protein [Streptomyces sp. NRRL S-813]|nr:hypothetical protein [Streptomyces sp. NRRL S-813]